jgi:hypothetical protein
MDDNNRRRWVPWTREADEKAKLYSTIAGLFLAVITSGTGVLRVGKYTAEDAAKSVKQERLITEAQIAAAIRAFEKDCQITKGEIEKRIDSIERVDTITSKSVEACQTMAKQYGERLNYIERNIWGNK